jgi:hypothetical protein
MNTSCLKMNTIVSKHVGSVIIYKLIVTVLLLVSLTQHILQYLDSLITVLAK